MSPNEDIPRVKQTQHPVWEMASVRGLTFDDMRLSGYSTATGVSVANAYGTASARANGSYGSATANVSANETTLGIASATRNDYERYTNTELQDFMIRKLEESGLVGCITNDSPVQIEAIITGSDSTTSFLQYTYDTLILLPILIPHGLGCPLMGNQTVAIQLRVKENGRLTQKIDVASEARWTSRPPIFNTVERASDAALKGATMMAVNKAIFQLQQTVVKR